MDIITIGRYAVSVWDSPGGGPLPGRPWLGGGIGMKRCFAFGGVLYAGVGLFLFLAVYLRGNDSAYTSQQNWSDALEVGLTWPWHVLQYFGIGG